MACLTTAFRVAYNSLVLWEILLCVCVSTRLRKSERGFVLDGVPLSKLANDETGRTQPSLNFGIPPYSPLHDKNCKTFFQSKGLPKGIKDSFQKESEKGKTASISEQFVLSSSAVKYLDDRKKIGAG